MEQKTGWAPGICVHSDSWRRVWERREALTLKLMAALPRHEKLVWHAIKRLVIVGWSTGNPALSPTWHRLLEAVAPYAKQDARSLGWFVKDLPPGYQSPPYRELPESKPAKDWVTDVLDDLKARHADTCPGCPEYDHDQT